MIETDRLLLIPMTPAFLGASLASDTAAAESELGFRVPPAWLEEQWLMRLRLDELHENPAAQPWLLRAICLPHERAMVGHIGFHGPPGSPHLQSIAPGGVEIGYTVFPAFRRRGYAGEACAGLIAWAAAEHGIHRFVLSISSHNVPSMAIARRLGFRKVGSHIDEIDGPEDVWLREIDAPAIPNDADASRIAPAGDEDART